MTELETKTERITEMLSNEGLDGVLLNAQHNFAWLSCGGSNGIDMSREGGAGSLFVTRDGRRHLIANNIEMPRLLAEEISETDFEPVELSWQSERDPQTILSAARSVAGGENIGSDIGFPGTRGIEHSVSGCRFELTPDEIERFRSLGRDAGRTLQNVIPRLEIGETENQISQIVRDELATFDIFPVVTLIGADERISNYRHPIATDKVWRDTLLVVVCARRRGLIVSLSRMICAGEVPPDLQQRTEACAAVNAALYNATRKGVTGSELYDVAANAYAAQGFAGEIAKHHQGGACGYRTRDWVAHAETKDTVRQNQGFAWNPSITGTKTEETAILIDDCLEIISASDAFPKISVTIDGREYFSPGILSLSKGASA